MEYKVKMLKNDLNPHLEDIRLATGSSREQFTSLMGMSEASYESILSSSKGISAPSLMRLCDALGLDIDQVSNGRLDLGALAKQSRHDFSTLPERYENEKHKRSKMRSVQTIYQAMVRMNGSAFARKILNRFQVSPMHLTDSNAFVSLHLVTDLLGELRRIDSREESVRALGTLANEVNKSTPLGQALEKAPSPREAYRAMHEELMSFFDRNWEYRLLRMSDTDCEVEIVTRPETAEAFSQHSVGTREGCLCRQGIYQSILRHTPNGQLARIEEKECMYLGSHRCVYRVIWDH